MSSSTRQAVSTSSRAILSRSARVSRLAPQSTHSTHTLIKSARPSALKLLPTCKARHCFSTTTITRQEQQQEQEQETTHEMNSGEQDIYDILTKKFKPATLQVQDVSGGCGSFYAIVIASTEFNGKPTVKAHRLVNEALKDVISGIHGLQLRTMPVKS